MLALFGAPFLDRIIACYQEVTPLAAGWRDRVPLHQLHPLLVHVCLFGAGTGRRRWTPPGPRWPRHPSHPGCRSPPWPRHPDHPGCRDTALW